LSPGPLVRVKPAFGSRKQDVGLETQVRAGQDFRLESNIVGPYRRILGIEAPWYVDSVELKLEAGEIHVHLAHHGMIDCCFPSVAGNPPSRFFSPI